MTVSVNQIKELREATGSGILDCRQALQKANGDYDKAVDLLRQKGLAKAAKRSNRDASEGKIELYSHGGGRIGVIVEVNCETDFVARSEGFLAFVHEIALQIAAVAPKWVKAEDVPEEVIEREKEIARKRYQEEGKPDHIIERILEGVAKKFKSENCLMEQEYIRDDSLTIEKMLHEKIASLGENIVIRRFERWELGESIDN
ncbi:MAG: translation elongation factor Ts [Anaerolineaceae bacterium 4572_5.2]|nr:MAG: translation elongation factor Ts [Anaerolineaceae bacterium 4572_5.2]